MTAMARPYSMKSTRAECNSTSDRSTPCRQGLQQQQQHMFCYLSFIDSFIGTSLYPKGLKA